MAKLPANIKDKLKGISNELPNRLRNNLFQPSNPK